MYISPLFPQRPIKPIAFVVLTIGIVVAVLRSTDLIAHQEHRQTKREHHDSEEILHLTISTFLNFRGIGRTLNATIPAAIVVCTITIIFSIGLIVFPVIRNQVVEGESVV